MDLLIHDIEEREKRAHQKLDPGFRCYAATGWTEDDVIGKAMEAEISLTAEQAKAFLEQQGKYIVDAMVAAGFTAIEVLLPDFLEGEPADILA